MKVNVEQPVSKNDTERVKRTKTPMTSTKRGVESTADEKPRRKTGAANSSRALRKSNNMMSSRSRRRDDSSSESESDQPTKR